MKRISWLMIVPLVLAAVGAPIACVEFQTFTFEPGEGGGGAGGTGSGGMSSSSTTSSSTSSSSGMPECKDDDDCIVPECKTMPKCLDGVCTFENVANGESTTSQIFGDCKERVCDGNGNVTTAPGDPSKDTYIWTNPCYQTSCNSFPTPVAVPNDPPTTCMTPWGNPMGYCSAFKCIECATDMDCKVTGTCRNDRCVAMSCTNNMPDPGETDIDCGGPDCLPCTAGKACTQNADCDGVCDTMGSMLCQAPTCSDGIRDNTETDIDCGGGCVLLDSKPCKIDQNCLFPADCETGVCKAGKCQTARCDDYVKNQDEEGIDCGGQECAPCPPNSP